MGIGINRITQRLNPIRKVISILLNDFRSLSFRRARSRLVLRLKEAYTHFLKQNEIPHSIHDPKLIRLRNRARDLRRELKSHLRWSILIDASSAQPEDLNRSIESCLEQMLPGDELWVGVNFSLHENLKNHLGSLSTVAAERSLNLHIHPIAPNENVLNTLAVLAKCDYLFVMEASGWIRPDSLYRFQQVYLSNAHPSRTALYCDENQMNSSGEFILGTTLQKPNRFPLPFVFSDTIAHCLSVSKSAWMIVKGVPEKSATPLFDLCLKLDQEGYALIGVPLLLYSRLECLWTSENSDLKTEPTILRNYFAGKALSVSFDPGKNKNAYRPNLTRDPNQGVVVIVPFHNEVEMTVRCLSRLREISKDRRLHVICVNNRSDPKHDLTELKNMPDQWIDADFAFNYSRINNLAFSQCSVKESDFPLVLFLNNDVILNPDAVSEMAAWLQFQKIGIVGARLFYPNGLIQHGGIAFTRDSSSTENHWAHLDPKKPPSEPLMSSTILITDAVTAACAMMRRSDFLTLKGFDEIQYPIAYSDTDLCTRIRKDLNLFCLMTPYAEGIHHESLSRGKNDLEDYEASGWLSENLHRNLPSVTSRFL